MLIPEFVINKDLQTVQEIASSLERDWKEILRECVPKILVHILPLFAASRLGETGDDENVKRRTSKATACYDLLIKEISNEVGIVRKDLKISSLVFEPHHEKTCLCDPVRLKLACSAIETS